MSTANPLTVLRCDHMLTGHCLYPPRGQTQLVRLSSTSSNNGQSQNMLYTSPKHTFIRHHGKPGSSCTRLYPAPPPRSSRHLYANPATASSRSTRTPTQRRAHLPLLPLSKTLHPIINRQHNSCSGADFHPNRPHQNRPRPTAPELRPWPWQAAGTRPPPPRGRARMALG
jgi:hypothetical protein